jgi:hypothetical protein
MRNVFLLSIFIAVLQCCSRCSEVKHLRQSIDFETTCAKETNNLRIPICNVELNNIFSQNNLIFGTITNNSYDTLTLYLYKTSCYGLYSIRSDRVDYYYLYRDSLNNESSDLIFIPPYDTTVKIQKENNFSFIFYAECESDSIFRKKYHFSLDADSSGVKKHLIVTYSPPAFESDQR